MGACVWPAFQIYINGRALTLHPTCSSTLVNALAPPFTPVINGSAAPGQVPLSIYVIADLDSDDGLGTLQAALGFSVC